MHSTYEKFDRGPSRGTSFHTAQSAPTLPGKTKHRLLLIFKLQACLMNSMSTVYWIGVLKYIMATSEIPSTWKLRPVDAFDAFDAFDATSAARFNALLLGITWGFDFLTLP